MTRPAATVFRPFRPALAAAGLLALASLQSGCQACWSVNDGCGSSDWGCGNSAELTACDGDAALLIGAIYLALAIPYLIDEALNSCH